MNKQIEEMAKVMCHQENCEGNCIERNCEMTWYAEALYNAGYRKVNDKWVFVDKGFFDDLVAGNITRYIKETGNIILEKEEYAKLQSKCDSKVCFTADEMVEQANKQKAREILQEVKQRIYDREIEAERILRYIKFDELEKKFGVEVE